MSLSLRPLLITRLAALVRAGAHRLRQRPIPDDPDRAARFSLPFAIALEAILTETDRAMLAAPITGSHDHNFAAMMIPHHWGAIAMARAELRYGTDPALRRLAQEMIVTHQREILAMRQRLAETMQRPTANAPRPRSRRRIAYDAGPDS